MINRWKPLQLLALVLGLLLVTTACGGPANTPDAGDDDAPTGEVSPDGDNEDDDNEDDEEDGDDD